MARPKLRKAEQVGGGEIVSRMLAAEGVDTVFGIIDGTYFGLYNTFAANGITLVTPRHEASAVHAAGAYARLTGKLGVCIASNGPGVANALAGVAVENAEGNRVLLITSWRREGIAGPDRGGSYQYFAQADVTRPMTRFSCAVRSVDRLAEVMRRALRACFTGRPGVVHVDIPESLFNGSFDSNPAWFAAPERYRVTEPLAPAQGQLERAAGMLQAAKLPLLHAGSGVVHAKCYPELAELAELLGAPVTTSWGARCAMDERSVHSVPMVHIEAVNKARNDADLVLALGSRLGETDWWGKPPYWAPADKQQLIQVDLDPDTLGNTRPADLLVQADVKVFLRQLIATLRKGGVEEPSKARIKQLEKIGKQCAKHRKKLDRHLKDHDVPMNPAHVATVCQRVLGDDAALIIDGGNTAVWANFYHQVRVPGRVVSTPKMGMLGAGLGQTLGASAAFPDKTVYAILGDGAMGFHMQEVETAVRNQMPILFIVLCDRQWGMVKMTQQFLLKPLKTLVMKSLSPEETINTELAETRFDDLGRAMGAYGERVADPEGLEGALLRCKASGRASVIHVDVDRVKHLWAPALKYFKDMHKEPAG